MISLIVCSVKPDLLALLRQSVANTIGCEFEFIIYDNRLENKGLCSVYNACADKARFPYLCFVHEDVQFDCQGWGMELIHQFEQVESCGVIGVAGSKYVPRNFISWGDSLENDRCNYLQFIEHKNAYEWVSNNPDKESFSEVVTLDGVFLFTKQSIWKEIRFDEDSFSMFHLYDADFAVSVATKYRNYVCQTIKLKHLSAGSGTSSEYYSNLKVFHKKWKAHLPLHLSSLNAYRKKSGRAKEKSNMAFLYDRMTNASNRWSAMLHLIMHNQNFDALFVVTKRELAKLIFGTSRGRK